MVLESRTPSALAAFSLALALALPAPSSAAPPDSDAITAARFSITIDGVQVASFSELSALTSNVQLALAPEGGYHLANAWPSKIEIGSLRSGSSQVLMETVTITCERVQRVSP